MGSPTSSTPPPRPPTVRAGFSESLPFLGIRTCFFIKIVQDTVFTEAVANSKPVFTEGIMMKYKKTRKGPKCAPMPPHLRHLLFELVPVHPSKSRPWELIYTPMRITQLQELPAVHCKGQREHERRVFLEQLWECRFPTFRTTLPCPSFLPLWDLGAKYVRALPRTYHLLYISSSSRSNRAI